MRRTATLALLLALAPLATRAQTVALTPTATDSLLAATPAAVVLDVRRPAEAALSGRLAGARVVDVTAPGFEARALALVPPGVPVVVYCRSGRRAEAAAARLAARGVGPLFNAGGFEALARAGLTTEGVPPQDVPR